MSSRFTRFFVSENTLSQILVFELVLQIDADIHWPHHVFSYPPIVWDIPDLFSRMIFCPFFSNQTRSLLHSLISPAGRSFCCKCTAATAQSCHFFLTYRGCFVSMRFSISNSRRHLQFISAGYSNFIAVPVSLKFIFRIQFVQFNASESSCKNSYHSMESTSTSISQRLILNHFVWLVGIADRLK